MKKLTPKQVFIILFAVVGILLIIRYTDHSSQNLSLTQPQKQTLSATPAPIPTVTSEISPQSTSNATHDTAIINALLIRHLHGTNQSGIVYSSQNVQVQYVATDSIFEAEVLTPNIAAAKTETEIWFEEQGLSQNGLCRLLIFYINPAIKANLPPTEARVNLLPDGC